MLSRIAESLFWIGRYVERADDTARILDVHLYRLLEDPWTDEESACRALLSIMGLAPPDPDEPVGATSILERLAYDLGGSSSIAGSLQAARENARGARETIPTELWEALNTTGLQEPDRRRTGRRTGAHTYFRWVHERCAVVTGLAEGTLRRDEGWQFLVLGRSLERVDMTTRLLMAFTVSRSGASSWASLLRSCGGYETFLRTYRGGPEERLAVEFMLVDRMFPRSVLFALSTAEKCLAELAPPHVSPGDTEARRLLGRARTSLEFRGTDELLATLVDDLENLQRICSQASESLERYYFPTPVATAWEQEEGP